MGQRKENELVVEELTKKFNESKSAILTDYRGLDVAEVTELRDKLREAGVDYKVVKNTLAFLAAKEAGHEEIKDFLTGPTAIAFSVEDPVAPAKVLSEFADDHEDLEIKSGIVEGDIIDVDGVTALADIPPREVLLGQVARGMKAPITGLVRCLNHPLKELVQVLNQIKEEK